MTAPVLAPESLNAVPTAGVVPPMITPLRPDGEVDVASTAEFSRFLIEAGATGLLVLGSSGENAALSADQRRAAVQAVVEAAAGRVPVLAGVAALGTPDAVRDAADFAALGADSLLVSAPFGFEHSPDELVGHFAAVAAAAEVPVLAYEVPSRVKVSLGVDLVVRLVRESIIVGLKDSSGNLGAARLRSAALRDLALGDLDREVPHFTGSEECIDGFLLGGGSGCVPGLANVFPDFHVALCDHAADGDWVRASAVQGQIAGLLDLYWRPIPGGSFTAQFLAVVKEALVQLGVIEHNTAAAPFRQADEEVTRHVAAVLKRAADLNPA